MSLVNVSLSPTRALIAVDTEALNAQENILGEVSKMTLLPHANIVLAGRGLSFILGSAFQNAVMAWPCNFETLEKFLPTIIAPSIDYLVANKAQFFPHTSIDGDDFYNIFGQDLLMVGYSESRGRIACVRFSLSRQKEMSTFELEPIDASLSPWSEDWEEIFDPSTPELMRSAAKIQLERSKSIEPDAPLGGRLLLCELTKDEAKFSSLGAMSY